MINSRRFEPTASICAKPPAARASHEPTQTSFACSSRPPTSSHLANATARRELVPVTDDLRGDFVRDARDDEKFPDTDTWSEIKFYLSLKPGGGVREITIEAARQLWNECRVIPAPYEWIE